MAKIIDTRWRETKTGQVLRIESTTQSRQMHHAVNETTGYTQDVLQADLDAGYERLDDDEQGGDEGDDATDD